MAEVPKRDGSFVTNYISRKREAVRDGGDVEVALAPDPSQPKESGSDDVTPSTTPLASVLTTPATTAKEEPSSKSWCRKLIDFYNDYDFFILLVTVILLAYAYPPLGATYLQPQITASWIAVMYIFCKFFIVHVVCFWFSFRLFFVLLGSLGFATTRLYSGLSCALYPFVSH